MMPRCVAPGCSNDSGDVTFLPFPVQAEAAERWAGLCGVTGQERGGEKLLCSRHFEDEAFERDPDSASNGRSRLRQGAEPTLFLNAGAEPTLFMNAAEDRPPETQVDGSSGPPEVRSSCGCNYPSPQTSERAQVSDPQKPPQPRICSAGTPDTTVLNPQPGVSQIVLNFRNNGVTLVPASPEGVCHCPQSQQKVLKQVVLLLLDHPCRSPPLASQNPPLLLNARTQTEGPMSHHAPGDPGNNGGSSGGHVEGTPSTAEPCQTGQSPASLLHAPPTAGSQTQMSLQEPTQSVSSQTEPPGGGAQHCSRPQPALTVDSWSQTALDMAPPSTLLRDCGIGPSSACAAPGNQVTPPDPPLPACSRCPCAQSRVRQIVLNFLEEESKVTQDPDTRITNLNPPPPAHQHQETQTGEDLLPLRGVNENPCGPQHLERPGKSRSCPPGLSASSSVPLYQEESCRHLTRFAPCLKPQPSQSAQEDKVLFEDIVIYFSKDEWDTLGSDARGLYREVMSENYRSLLSLGLLVEKPHLVSRIEDEDEDLWEDGAGGRDRRAEDVRLVDPGTGGVRFLKSPEAPDTGRESAESSSHLGALMRLVNEIPGFLFGGSGVDGGSSPVGSWEDHENVRAYVEVKVEGGSPARAPVSSRTPPLMDTPDPGPRNTEPGPGKVTVKVEEQVALSPRPSVPSCHPGVSPVSIKHDPGARPQCLQIKEEVPVVTSPARAPALKTRPPHTPDPGRRPCSRGGTSPRAAAPVTSPRHPGSSPRHPGSSPARSDGASSMGLADLKIKIKQEDSGSERDSMESPLCDRKVYNSPTMSPSNPRQLERDHWRPSPRRTPESVVPGSSPLHKLVNCLKEITSGRPRAHSNVFSPAHWGPDMSRTCADLRAGGLLGSRGPEIMKPNPFTAAAMNGTTRLRSRETRTPENHGGAPIRAEPGSAALSALGKMSARVFSGQKVSGAPRSEETRRLQLGVKRTHSDDLNRLPGASSKPKKPTLDHSSGCAPRGHDLWRPPEEIPPSDGQPIGKSHLMSVMDCVRKISSSRPGAGLRGAEPDPGRALNPAAEEKPIVVKVEERPSPSLPPANQWLQPPPHPDGAELTGSPATNVHLSGLMRLMEEIPCAESSSSSRAMFSIAVGHSVARRLDGPGYLSYDDAGFQAELNDCTADSVFSDDTSWSSENVDPSYSALGGLQKVVSDFAEVGSVSPLVAVAAPPVVTGVPEESGPKRPKEPVRASGPREGARRASGEAAGSAASTCSAENGAAAFAALCGLQKVVHGFVEQECVSPISAVTRNPPNTGQRDPTGGRPAPHDEEGNASGGLLCTAGQSPCRQYPSPAPSSRFLCDSGTWAPGPDSSYSALVGLQKVVNGFSEKSCVSPFSAVSTAASEPHDSLYPTPSGVKGADNGICDPGSDSPLTVTSYLSSEGEPDPGAKRRCDRANENPGRAHNNPRNPPGVGGHCIDLTQEEEPVSSQSRTPIQENQRKKRIREESSGSRPTESSSNRLTESSGSRPTESSANRPVTSLGLRATRPVSRGHLIDLTEEEEVPTKPKAPRTATDPKCPLSGSPQTRPLPDQARRPCRDLSHTQVTRDKPLDPGPSGPGRGGVPVVNEHLSGLEKLLKDVPSLTPTNNPRTPNWRGSWWLKSTSSHET